MFALFPSLIHQFDILSFNQTKDDLIKSVYEEKKGDSVGAIHSNRGGWQSKELSSGGIIVSTLKHEVTRYFISNNIFKEGTRVKFSNVWCNINKKGDYNTAHLHPGCNLSGCMWIKTAKDCGKIVFDNPQAFNEMLMMKSYSDEYINFYNNVTDYYLIPKEGNVIIFPSYLQHKVEENQSNTDRISVSFNIEIEPPL